MTKLFFKMLSVLILLLMSFGVSYAAIININSVTNHELNPVSLFLQSGVYTVDPIGVSEGGLYNAWNAWNFGQVTGCDANGENCTLGWINQYQIWSSEFPDMLITDGVRYSTAALALENALGTSFTLLNDSFVNFLLNDGPNGSLNWDNVGGISLDVTSDTVAPVPEPSTFLLLGAGLAGLAVMGIRRRKS